MQNLPNCPVCQSENTYHDTIQFICPDCGHEWSEQANDDLADEQIVVKDSNGNLLVNGDSVILIKDLKLKGSSEILKKGTKYKNIRLVTGDHNVECGKLQLKSEFLKKATS
ncbi:hypothetical protein V757_09385 [Pelistega indica]|uniref:Alkylphosphonate utilization protein n=1 Tax=Pelistega indica TaxID=1414851 RepID=V8FZT1_9BURK|nr:MULTISPECIES: zinc ribbon domain-containing protein YjdM [Pelistega]ETD69203.1 hypothetical protein V757_09385 [Pelistega indica]